MDKPDQENTSNIHKNEFWLYTILFSSIIFLKSINI